MPVGAGGADTAAVGGRRAARFGQLARDGDRAEQAMTTSSKFVSRLRGARAAGAPMAAARDAAAFTEDDRTDAAGKPE